MMLLLLSIGFLLLVGYALYKGHNLKSIGKMIWSGVKDSLIVAVVMLFIGCLTGLWRASGTVAYFITAGIRLMPPKLFVLFAFLLSSAMSFAIGTSFGVVATAGVILMSIARAGNVNPLPVAGAIMSGLYVGDRGSPAASSAALVAAITHTEQNRNIRMMLRSGAVPFGLCVLLYTGLSFLFPMQTTDTSVTANLENAFHLHWLCLLPAILMIVLPFLKVPLKLAMGADILISFMIAVALQNMDVLSALKTAVIGYTPDNPELNDMLAGGGLRSMLSVYATLLLSGTYSGLIKGTHLLDGVDRFLFRYREKKSRFGVMCLLSVACAALFCNQTITCVMVNQLSGGMYGDTDRDKYVKMLDIEDTAIVIAGLVPWCIACSMPLTTMGVNALALPFSFYLWLVPLCGLILRPKLIIKSDRE